MKNKNWEHCQYKIILKIFNPINCHTCARNIGESCKTTCTGFVPATPAFANDAIADPGFPGAMIIEYIKTNFFWVFSVNLQRIFCEIKSYQSQSRFTCGKLTIEPLEQGVKYVQS